MESFGIFVPKEPAMHVEALYAVAEGLNLYQIPHQLYSLEKGYRPCKFAVTFGVAKQRTVRGRMVGQVVEKHYQLSSKSNHLVIERGFIHRDRYFMMGWGGLNGRAEYFNRFSPGGRWKQLNVDVAPWRTAGEHVVLCGQVPWDASVQHVDHAAWCRDTARALNQLTTRRIIFRPHPLATNAINMSAPGVDIVLSKAASLSEDLQNAWAVVTFNSNAGVEATLAGVPAFVSDPGAMGYSLLNKDLRKIETPNMPNRTKWLHSLAYTQWTLEEAAKGLPIEHLWGKRRPLLKRFVRALAYFYHCGQIRDRAA